MFRRRMSRPGWIDAPRASLRQWETLARFADEVRRDGLTRVVLCGMGGSSLAPQVLAATWASPSFSVLDSTDPAAVLAVARAPGLDRTLFLITSKSGTTVETLAFYHYFAACAEPQQFVAMTDPGTPLETLARERGFRAVFHHPVDVGGRYAALTVVGMLPAALLGIDGRVLLERALAVTADQAQALGGRLADAAGAGRAPRGLDRAARGREHREGRARRDPGRRRSRREAARRCGDRHGVLGRSARPGRGIPAVGVRHLGALFPTGCERVRSAGRRGGED